MSGPRAFTPQREPSSALASRTVGRTALLDALRNKIAAAADSAARPHVLLAGPPGSGKTHLLEVALADADERLVVVRVREDAIGVTRFEDLTAAVLTVLRPGAALPPPAQREDRIAALLGDRVVLLVIERLDRVFGDLGLAGQRALRAWVETSGAVLIVGTADRVLRGLLQREQPWFGGMAVFMLPGLTAEQGRDLMLQIASDRREQALAEYLRTPAGLARARALAALTAGTPRVWTLVAECATAAGLDALLPAVEDLLESLAGHHEQVVSRLSPNERRLVAAIVASPGAATVSELAAASEIEQRTAAGALGRLADAGWVTAVKPTAGDRRTTYYLLRDPLLRLHLLYVSGDPRLPLTVGLLREFHGGPDGSRSPASELLDAMRSGEAPSASVGAMPLAGTLLAAAQGDERAAMALVPELRALATIPDPSAKG